MDGESRDPKAASLDVSLDASSGGNVNAGVQHGEYPLQLTVKPVPASVRVR